MGKGVRWRGGEREGVKWEGRKMTGGREKRMDGLKKERKNKVVGKI